MNLGGLGVNYAAIKGHEWAIVGVAIATVAAVFWEGWEAKMGNVRPGLKSAIGIGTAFLGGISVERGIAIFHSNANSHRRIFDVLIGLMLLGLSIYYTFNLKWPLSVAEWPTQRDNPPSMFDKKND
jgi:hypothetical protein